MSYREIIRRDALAKIGTQACSSFAKPPSTQRDPSPASSLKRGQGTTTTSQRVR